MLHLPLEVTRQIEASRLRDLTLDLVRIPSPTGDCAVVAEAYAQRLRDIGLDVSVKQHDGHPRSPSVVAHLRGRSSGRTLQFDGHLDTIRAAHAPPGCDGTRIHGRGAADMKSGLAAVAEVARVLAELDERLAGDLLITAHGMHEAPWARGETLRQLIDAGHVGDAVVCAEGALSELPVVGKGLGIFEITIRREGDAVHEVAAPEGMPHPILVGHSLVEAMLEANRRFSETRLPLGLGSESYFIGQFEAGDFYNRVPTECRIVGTRRYAPNLAFSEVEAEFHAMMNRVARETGATVDSRFWRQRDGFELDPATPIAVALRNAYACVHGRQLPLVGMKYVADSSIFIREAGVPALQYGTGLARAHADHEWVDVQDIVDMAKVLLHTAIEFLGVAA